VLSLQGSVLVCTGLVGLLQATRPDVSEWIYMRPLAVYISFYLIFFIGVVTQLTTSHWVEGAVCRKSELAKVRQKVRKKYGRQK
jgi:hypothetical protein